MSNVIVGTGSYLPETVLTNHDVEAMVSDYNRERAGGQALDEWARTRHGAISRRHAAPDEGTSDMALHAARSALADAGLDARDLDLIVMSTFSNDYRLPQSAGLLQAGLGTKAKFLQLDAACSGFVDGMLVAHGLMETQGYEHVLIVSADKLSYYIDPTKFKPLTVFGDGAGAVVLHRHASRGDGHYGIRSFSTGSDGELGHYVWVPGGGSKQPLTHDGLDQGLHYLRFKFPEINLWAVERMTRCTLEAVAKAGLTLDDVKWVVPHQASVNIILDVAHRLELPEEMFVIIYPYTGNVSGASIPLALDAANREGRFADGDWLVMPAVGAGMAWGALTYRWYDYRAGRDGIHNDRFPNGGSR